MPGTLKEALQTSEQAKLSYVETQIEEMEAIIRRNEVDIYINDNSEWSEDEQAEVDAKTRGYVKINTRLAKAIIALKKLKAELEA